MQAKNGCWSDENWLIQGWEELEESDTQHSFFEVMLKKKKNLFCYDWKLMIVFVTP